MKPSLCLIAVAVLLVPVLAVAAPGPAASRGPRFLTLDSPSNLVTIRVGVPVGSAQDPQGKEGLAGLTAQMLIEGSFGDATKPTTKEDLAEITRPWGERARPAALVGKEMTVFSMTVPEEKLQEFVEKVLRPMFTQPRFSEQELDRVRADRIVTLSSQVRFESQEQLGLRFLDNLLHEGTGLQHLELGSVQGLKAARVVDLRRFYGSFYRGEDLRVALSTAKEPVIAALRSALGSAGGALPARAIARSHPAPARRPSGRSLTIVTVPDAISTGLHAGFPIPMKRGHRDYWPLYVANVWFGTHRDSLGRLYELIRQQRGYNYGDYSYVEWMQNRPGLLFPPPNHPRSQQDFTIWLRPVGHDYAHHLLKAMLFELEELLAKGLTDEQVALARTKAKVIYLSLAEDTERRVAYRLDDDFYGLEKPYLDEYLGAVDAVTTDQVNAAMRMHLQARDVTMVVVTDDEVAPKLAEAVARGGAAYGKGPKDYNFETAAERYSLTPEQVEILKRDGAWAGYPLWIPRDRIRIVKAGELFETAKVAP